MDRHKILISKSLVGPKIISKVTKKLITVHNSNGMSSLYGAHYYYDNIN